MKNKFVDYYVKGCYHCDTCPFCWDDYNEYIGDGNCGCYIFGDLRDSCRLIPPIRYILGYCRRKKYEYFRAHEYDDFPEWCEKYEAEKDKFNDCFKRIILDHYNLTYKNSNGESFGDPIPSDRFLEFDEINLFRYDCADIFREPVEVSIKARWKSLIKDTWKKFIGKFKPYFCK